MSEPISSDETKISEPTTTIKQPGGDVLQRVNLKTGEGELVADALRRKQEEMDKPKETPKDEQAIKLTGDQLRQAREGKADQ